MLPFIDEHKEKKKVKKKRNKMFSERLDGRSMTQLRGKELRTTQLSQFDGSAWYAQGQTAVMAAVCGPVAARGDQDDYRRCTVEVAVVRSSHVATAGGAERSVVERRKRIQNTSDAELALYVASILQETILLDLFPRCVVQVSVDVLSDDGSLWSVALNAVMCALLDAAIPCRTTFAASQVLSLLSVDPQGRPQIQMKLDPTNTEEQALPAAGTTQVSSLVVHCLAASGGGTLGSKWTTLSEGGRPLELSDVQAIETLAEKVSELLLKFFRNCGVPPKADEVEMEM